MREGQITVCTNGSGVLADRLTLALAVAERLHWSIQVLTFRSDPPPPDMAPDLLGTRMATEDRQREWDNESAAVREARAAYDQLLGTETRPGTTSAAQWIEVFQPLASSFPSYARACDMIVAGGRSEDPAASTLNDEVSSLAVLESGRLVLLAPHPMKERPPLFSKLLIAWDDKPAAARTIAQALPLIARADAICVLVVESDVQRATPVNGILAYLRRHARNTTVRAVKPLLHSVGHSILHEAQAFGASLIVMGAYEYSRNREIIFGGTTRTVIDQADCPVLVSK